MAHEFCIPCKPNTKRSCAKCPRQRTPHPSTGIAVMVIRPVINFFGQWYHHADINEEEYF